VRLFRPFGPLALWPFGPLAQKTQKAKDNKQPPSNTDPQMTLGLSICWRGPPGSGKRNALQHQLQLWAKSISQIYCLKRQSWNAPLQGGEDSDEEVEETSEKALLPMEMSILHWGFDCARMSLQDKQYIKSILQRWGRGSQVLASAHSQRCLVFYHAHLLSSESVLFLQAFLEENYQDTILWLTSEHPLPPRLADWCIEIPVKAEKDKSLEALLHNSPAQANVESLLTPEQEILAIYKHWMTTQPRLSDVKQIRGIVYGLLHRNIRWTDGFHQWLFAFDLLDLSQEQKKALAQICIHQPFTGSGQTVPSYRIPILWENYLCNIRDVLAPPPLALPQPVATPKIRKIKKGNATISS